MTFAEYVALFKSEGRQMSTETYQEGLMVYARCAIRVRGGFELANIKVPEAKQKQGIFSAFLTEWEGQLSLMIENVANPYLRAHLTKRPGWYPLDPSGGTISLGSFVNRKWILEARA
jgi:hypothetical protein